MKTLVVFVGGFRDGYTGEPISPRNPTNFRNLLGKVFPKCFAKGRVTVHDLAQVVKNRFDAIEKNPREYEYLTIDFNKGCTNSNLDKHNPDPKYNIGFPFNKKKPEEISKQIACQIAGRFNFKDITEIIIVTYSAGALLTRSAMLEPSHEYWNNDWAESVTKIVMLSGIIKGWQFTTAFPALYRFFGQALLPIFNSEFMGWKFFNGSPFVVSTRIAYAKKFQDKPKTIFILGSRDQFMTPSDCLELDNRSNPVYLEIPNTNHMQMLTKATTDKVVSNLICEAIQKDVEDAKSPEWINYAANLTDIDDFIDPYDKGDSSLVYEDVEKVVMIIHGIRDNGFWTKRISREIKKKWRKINPSKPRAIRVVTPSYGFFSMWDFLVPGGRRRALYWFLDKYGDIKALYPKAETIDLIAHSNGTYLGAEALKQCDQAEFTKVIFAGSVVRRDFWDKKLRGKLNYFYNFIGRDDLVVGLLPGAMEIIPYLNKRLNVGGAGSYGFYRLPQSNNSKDDPTEYRRSEGFNFWNKLGLGKDVNSQSSACFGQRMIIGGHGAAIRESCWKVLAEYIVQSEPEKSIEEIVKAEGQENPNSQHPLVSVRRSWIYRNGLTLLKIFIGIIIFPLLGISLLFPVWYPMLLLSGTITEYSKPIILSLPLFISPIYYLFIYASVYLLRNGLRYL
jgi:pimeloyl-ACP methyl ester carboxylesterase